MRRFDWREISSKRMRNIPEILSGFDPELPSYTREYGLASFYEDLDREGVYQVDIALEAVRETDELFLFAGRKNLCYYGSLSAGERLKVRVYVHAGDIIPRYHSVPCAMRKVFVTAACRNPENLGGWDIKVSPVPAGVKTVYLAGDSTVAHQISEVPYHPGACFASWGQALTAYVGGTWAVDNQAHCGLSTETFRKEGHMDIIRREIRPGDVCMFQFAHNDQKQWYLQPSLGYRENLCRFLDEIREKQGVPVLVTPLGRNTWLEGGSRYLDLLEEYAVETASIGKEQGVPVIDLHRYSTGFYQEKGFEESKGYFHPGDMTHTNEYGAVLFAGVVADGLRQCVPGFGACTCGVTRNMEPAAGLWDALKQEGDARNMTDEEKEQFDALEKSQDNLIRAVEEARAGFRKFHEKCL